MFDHIKALSYVYLRYIVTFCIIFSREFDPLGLFVYYGVPIGPIPRNKLKNCDWRAAKLVDVSKDTHKRVSNFLLC